MHFECHKSEVKESFGVLKEVAVVDIVGAVLFCVGLIIPKILLHKFGWPCVASDLK